ncbi:unnamed protein product, partial [Rotaria sp. Silwood2]
KVIYNPTSSIYRLLSGTYQIISCYTLSKTIFSIFEYLYQHYDVIVSKKQINQLLQSYLNLNELNNRPLT